MIATLGQQLNAEACRLARRRGASPHWLLLVEPVVRRWTSFATARARRYARVEVDGRAPSLEELANEAEPELTALPGDVRLRLRDVVGPDADALRPHGGPVSDYLAARSDADAVAIGRDVFFASDQFRPRDTDGFGLLAHEATHVAEFERPGAGRRRATSSQKLEEEAVALNRELVVRSGEHYPRPRPTDRAVVAETAAGRPPAAPSTPPPMTAAADRDLGAEQPGAGGEPLDVDELRRSIYRDLMLGVKTDYERGG